MALCALIDSKIFSQKKKKKIQKINCSDYEISIIMKWNEDDYV